MYWALVLERSKQHSLNQWFAEGPKGIFPGVPYPLQDPWYVQIRIEQPCQVRLIYPVYLYRYHLC